MAAVAPESSAPPSKDDPDGPGCNNCCLRGFPICCGAIPSLKSAIKIVCIILGILSLLHTTICLFVLITSFLGSGELPYFWFFVGFGCLNISFIDIAIELFIAINLKDYHKSMKTFRQVLIVSVILMMFGLFDSLVTAYLTNHRKNNDRFVILWVLNGVTAVILGLLGYMIILVSYFAQEVKYTFVQPKDPEVQEEPIPSASENPA